METVMTRNSHPRKDMKKNKKYIITCKKTVDAHRWRHVCDCPDVVLNLRGGLLVWTHVEFDCGERIKINCSCLEKA